MTTFHFCPACQLYIDGEIKLRATQMPMFEEYDLVVKFCDNCVMEAKDIMFEDGGDLYNTLLDLVPFTKREDPQIVKAAAQHQKEYDGPSFADQLFEALKPPTRKQLLQLTGK
jgi:hypothetical protein